VGQFLVGVLDGSDADTDQDYVPAVGTVTLTPSIPYTPNVTAGPNPVTMLLPPVTAVIDDQGYLSTPAQGTLTPAYRGVWLTATDDPDLSVTGWTWTASYKLSPVNGSTLALPSHSFVIPAGGTLDLSTVVAVPSSPGLGTEQAEALAASAQAAAVASAASAAAAAASAAPTDSNVAALVTGPATSTRTAVQAIAAAAAGPKLDAATASTTYAAKSVETSKLDASTAATTYAAKSVETSKLDASVAATTYAAKSVETSKLDASTAATTYAAKSVETSKLDASQKGAASGVATLDAGTKVPVAQLPAATSVAAGTMSAADKATADAATNAATPSTLVKRDANGDVAHRRATVTDAPGNANEVTRKDYVDAINVRFSPAGALATTMDRRTVAAASVPALTSGTMRLTAVWLPKGAIVSSITYLSGAVPAGLTNRWFALLDGSRNLLRTTADNTGAWTAGATLTLPLTSTYTVPADGLYYVGFCEVATTVTALRGMGGSSNAMSIPPILNGDSGTALTNAASTPATSPAITAQGGIPYAYVS